MRIRRCRGRGHVLHCRPHRRAFRGPRPAPSKGGSPRAKDRPPGSCPHACGHPRPVPSNLMHGVDMLAHRSRDRILTLAAGAVLALTAVAPAGAAAPTRTTADLRASALQPSDRITAAKSPSSRLARTDPALAARTDGAMVN